MPLARLRDVLRPAVRDGRAVAGVVVLGWEDACAYVQAAQAVGCPVILQAGPGCRAHTPVEVLGPMFAHLASTADVPVVAHIDHARTLAECEAGIAAGFTSVMIDGSALPFDDNVALTHEAVRLAHGAGVCCEGEIGYVGYAQGEVSATAGRLTDPQEAARFAEATGVDALAVSVGNVHLQTEPGHGIDRQAVAAIQSATAVPLVIHGGSGVPEAERRWLAANTSIAKFNIGTELRQAFGTALRESLAEQPDVFDRNRLLAATIEPVRREAARVMAALWRPRQ